MSKLVGRVNKLERTDKSREVQREAMSEEEERSIIQQLSQVELSVCPDLELVTEADTDPHTFKEIQRTLTEARGEFEPEAPVETPPEARSAPLSSAPRRRRPRRHRQENLDSMMEALELIDAAIATSGDQAVRMERAVESARRRLGLQ